MDYFINFFEIASIGFKYVLNVFALIAIYDGVRRIYLKKYSKSVFIILIVGLTYSLGSSGHSYFMSGVLESIERPNEGLKKLGALPDDWGVELALTDRVERTQSIAMVYFKEFGELTRVIDHEGNWTIFMPSEEVIKSRGDIIAQNVELKMTISRFYSSFIYWLVSTLIAVLLGLASAHPKLSRELGFGS